MAGQPSGYAWFSARRSEKLASSSSDSNPSAPLAKSCRPPAINVFACELWVTQKHNTLPAPLSCLWGSSQFGCKTIKHEWRVFLLLLQTHQVPCSLCSLLLRLNACVKSPEPPGYWANHTGHTSWLETDSHLIGSVASILLFLQLL